MFHSKEIFNGARATCRSALAVGVASILFCERAIAQDASLVSTPKLYSFDSFSLLSFGLTITALLLSFFMAWLSWEFYKKSVEASEKTHETVTKIEGIVAGVQSSISEIVNKAVTHWVEGGDASRIGEVNEDLMQRLQALETAISQGGGSDQSELINAVRAQVEQLSRSSREMQIKSIFPSYGTEKKVVEASQEITSSEERSQTGLLRIKIVQPTKIATATLRFEPPFDEPPEVTASLITSPLTDTSGITAKPGTPSRKSCNFHINSSSDLPEGEYVFEFNAVAAE